MKEKHTEWIILSEKLEEQGIDNHYDGNTWHIANIETDHIDDAIAHAKLLLSFKGVIV